MSVVVARVRECLTPTPASARCSATRSRRSAARSAPGQVEMAEAVAAAMDEGRHLLVQAGTGTGKSLAYLVPSLLHGDRVVVATATLALQHQLVERDIPRLVEALGRPRRRRLPRRAQGPLQLRLPPPDPRGRARRPGHPRRRAPGVDGRARCSSCGPGPSSRPSRAAAASATTRPRHTDREWRQVSVGHRDCLGASKCPFGQECFVEVGPRGGPPQPPRRHQPLAARDRRHRGRADDPRLRRGRDRRGPRAGRPG